MFNIGPMELMVLAIVGLIVLGPDRLPGLAKDAAKMLKTLREMANGAKSQLREELGPEFADVDLRTLNPRTAIQRAVLGDEDLSSLNPRRFLDNILSESDEVPNEVRSEVPNEVIVSMVKAPAAEPAAAGPQAPPVAAAASAATAPTVAAPTFGAVTPYDADAT